MRFYGGLCCLLVAGGLSSWGAQFTPASDICTDSACNNVSSSYNGPNAGNTVVFGNSSPADFRGVSEDGGHDAFDNWGWVSNIGSLSLNVHASLDTSANVFRWLITLANNTGSQVNQNINFMGDLGSDGSTTVQSSGTFYRVSSDGNPPGDPVVGLIFGNNAIAQGFTITTGLGFQNGPNERVSVGIPVSLGAGQSVGYLFQAFLAWDTTNRSGDIALATTTTQNLVNNPDVSGFSGAEIASIANFGGVQATVPEPSTFVLLGGALVTLGLVRRRRK